MLYDPFVLSFAARLSSKPELQKEVFRRVASALRSEFRKAGYPMTAPQSGDLTDLALRPWSDLQETVDNHLKVLAPESQAVYSFELSRLELSGERGIRYHKACDFSQIVEIDKTVSSKVFDYRDLMSNMGMHCLVSGRGQWLLDTLPSLL